MENLVYRIKNLIKWFSIIWNDQYYDEIFIFNILRHKLKQMEGGFKKHSHHVGGNRVMKELRTCIILLTRIIDNEYLSMVFQGHDKKWGKLRHYSKKTVNPYLNELCFTRENVKDEKDALYETKESQRLFERAEYLHEQDIIYLFHIMRKKIRTWWD